MELAVGSKGEVVTTNRTFGRFVVLGVDDDSRRGGTARVYRAEDPGDHALVALKVAATREGPAAEAIRHEAEALRTLRHPGIVGYVDEGETEDGTPFLATEWLAGESLSDRLGRGPLSVDDTLLLARELAHTLAFIHGRGFVHRDLKPGNVMLVDGDLRKAKLVDFGFARRVREPAAIGGDTFQRARDVMGTPAYMAPEQARGDDTPDPRADVYSFGALLYRCLTGQAPFAGRDALATLTRVLFDDPKPLRELAPHVPERVASLIGRALRKEPSRRPKDGAAFSEALRELDGDPGPASIAPMPIARTLVCVVLCRLPATDPAAPDVLASWGRRVRTIRDLAFRDDAEFRLLGEGNVALLFDDHESARSASELATRATTAATDLARAIPGSAIGVACAHGTKTTSGAELLESARALVEGVDEGVIVDLVVDALLPPTIARERTPTGRRLR